MCEEQIDCYAMYTSNPPAGAFRGFGVTQSAFAVESNMDILAHELGIDPSPIPNPEYPNFLGPRRRLQIHRL